MTLTLLPENVKVSIIYFIIVFFYQLLNEFVVQHLSIQKDSEALKQKIKELQDVIARKEDEHHEQEKRLSMSKDHARVLVSFSLFEFASESYFDQTIVPRNRNPERREVRL